MVGFFAFVALLNLAIGYMAAVYVRGRSGRSVREFVADVVNFSPDGYHAAANATPTLTPPDDPRIGQEYESAPATKANVADAPRAAANSENDSVGEKSVEQLLAELTASSDPVERPASVVLVQLDATEGVREGCEDRMLDGILNLANELLADVQTAARLGNDQLLLMLPGDDELAATQLAERVRQRVEATEFVVDDAHANATVCCALTQLTTDYTVDDLLASLRDTLEEAQRMGGNRTLFYDGMTPLPVVPPELNLAPHTCAV
jgi:GGDEF domain-containing protein